MVGEDHIVGDGIADLINAYGVSEMGSFIYQFPEKDFRCVANDIEGLGEILPDKTGKQRCFVCNVK